MGEDAFLYINAGGEVNVYDCERGSVHAGMREEAKAFDREIRSALSS
jgi:septum formation inhibitor MinC